jgi:hypothetical protein
LWDWPCGHQPRPPESKDSRSASNAPRQQTQRRTGFLRGQSFVLGVAYAARYGSRPGERDHRSRGAAGVGTAGAHDAAPYDAPVPALVILKLLKPDDPRNGELLTALTDALGWIVPLEARFGRIEIGFVGDTMEEGMSRVGAALDQAGAELGVDWTDYLKFAGGMG